MVELVAAPPPAAVSTTTAPPPPPTPMTVVVVRRHVVASGAPAPSRTDVASSGGGGAPADRRPGPERRAGHARPPPTLGAAARRDLDRQLTVPVTATTATWPAMGTTVTVSLAGRGSDQGSAAAQRRVAELEARWSRFRPDSDVSRLNESAGRPVRVHPETLDLLDTARTWWQVTGGRFDPTVAGTLLERPATTATGPPGTARSGSAPRPRGPTASSSTGRRDGPVGHGRPHRPRRHRQGPGRGPAGRASSATVDQAGSWTSAVTCGCGAATRRARLAHRGRGPARRHRARAGGHRRRRGRHLQHARPALARRRPPRPPPHRPPHRPARRRASS